MIGRNEPGKLPPAWQVNLSVPSPASRAPNVRSATSGAIRATALTVARVPAVRRGVLRAGTNEDSGDPGRKADSAPSWLKYGIPDPVSELFEACLAWSRDVIGPTASPTPTPTCSAPCVTPCSRRGPDRKPIRVNRLPSPESSAAAATARVGDQPGVGVG
jgi:hypothetical protein